MAQTRLRNTQIEEGGWTSAGETWTYASADDPTFTFKVAADVTTKYSVGMKIKLTQGTVKYFIITAVSTYSGGNTTITVYGGTDYDLANSAISANAYSMVKSPYGFPMSPAKWRISTVSTSDIDKSSPTQNAWYNTGLSVNVPIGSWIITVQGYFRGRIASGAGAEIDIAVSTSTNSLSNSNWTHGGEINGVSGDLRVTINGLTDPIYVDLTSKTTHYLLFRTNYPNMSDLKCRGDLTPTILRATCAYL